jgi:hypothetical protein
LELKIHKCFLKKLLIWRSLAAKNIFLLFIKTACNKVINMYPYPPALLCWVPPREKLGKLPASPCPLQCALLLAFTSPHLPSPWHLPGDLQYPEEPVTHSGLGWCKWPLELVKWPCLPGKGHFRQLSADGFRGTCLDNENIWDNFPCGL